MIHLDSIGVNPVKVVETISQVKEIEEGLRRITKICSNNYKKVSRELNITEINANYLIKKLSKII